MKKIDEYQALTLILLIVGFWVLATLAANIALVVFLVGLGYLWGVSVEAKKKSKEIPDDPAP